MWVLQDHNISSKSMKATEINLKPQDNASLNFNTKVILDTTIQVDKLDNKNLTEYEDCNKFYYLVSWPQYLISQSQLF